jgi:putative membrane protein
MLILLIQFCLVAVAMLLVSYILPGVRVKNFGAAFVAAILLGLVNALLRPILMFLTAPINWLTLGLFALVINGILLKLVAEFIDGFEIDGWLYAIVGAILISIFSGVMMAVLL